MLGDFGIDLIRHGYRAIPRARTRAGGGDALPVRLLGRRALVVRGRDAVRHFYDTDLIRRHDAVPGALANLLFGRGAVHGLDGAAHGHRKAMFLDLLDEGAAQALGERVGALLRARLERERGHVVSVFDLLTETYGGAVLGWAGVEARDPIALSHCLAGIVDGFGGAGAAYPVAVLARIRANRWARGAIASARQHPVLTERPVDSIAHWRDRDGALLPLPVAAVELLNVLRPAVAVAFLGAFAVGALDDEPRWRARLADDGAREERRAFVHEVRRLAPFVPALAGRTRRPSEWSGYQLEHGRRVVLDVPGTDADGRIWPHPDTFDPQRFIDRPIDPYELVPQGGGPADGHRCPGEPSTITMLEATVASFAREYERAPWRVVDRGHDERRIPARERLELELGS